MDWFFGESDVGGEGRSRRRRWKINREERLRPHIILIILICSSTHIDGVWSMYKCVELSVVGWIKLFQVVSVSMSLGQLHYRLMDFCTHSLVASSSSLGGCWCSGLSDSFSTGGFLLNNRNDKLRMKSNLISVKNGLNVQERGWKFEVFSV
jgi:hypothetical protein